jgi:hypothetical protein
MRNVPGSLPMVYASRLIPRCSKVKEGKLGSFKGALLPGMETALLEIDWWPMRITVGAVRIVARVVPRTAAYDLSRAPDWMLRPSEAMIAQK